MNRRIVVLAAATVAALSYAGWVAWAEEETTDTTALAKVLPQASVTLEQGLRAAEPQGKPTSAKYEIEDGKLQLSVYTVSREQYSEVIVDHRSGAIDSSEPITSGDDFKAATAQGAVMLKAKTPLDAAVSHAVQAHAGWRAVSVTPALDGEHPVAIVVLMNGAEVKKLTEKLD